MNPLHKFGIFFVFCLLIVGGAYAATTTLRGNTVSYSEGGTQDNLENITLRNKPLFIVDATHNQLKAYFNFPIDEVLQVRLGFDEIESSNTSTGFLGNVDNFDNVDGFSRFRETNFNNGTNASSGFIGVNNIGRSISIGIGSNNFNFLGISLPNLGALRLNSPSPFFFANDFFYGWNWAVDKNNGTGFSDPEIVMSLDPSGNLQIDGNFTGNQFYGEMFVEANNDSTSISSANTYTKIGVLLEGLQNGFIFNDSDLITEINGTYKIDFALDFFDSNLKEFKVTVAIDGVDQDKCVTGRLLQANDVGNVGSTCLLELVQGEVVTLVIQNLDGDQDPTIIDANLNLVRVGS